MFFQTVNFMKMIALFCAIQSVMSFSIFAGDLGSKRPIAIFVRHCNCSSNWKDRPRGFSYERCLYNLLDTVKDEENISIVFLLDTHHPLNGETHVVYKQNRYPVVEFKGGSDPAAFLFLVDYVIDQNLDPDTIVYFLEDDFLHLPNWPSIMREAFTLPRVDYVTLYDHRDKYFLGMYNGLNSEIFHTASCHWRTTPSTVNTYAMLFSTLKRDLSFHKTVGYGAWDHHKFCRLRDNGATLVSSIPGYSTHLMSCCLSPCTDWEKQLESTQIPR